MTSHTSKNAAPQHPLYSWKTQSPHSRLVYIRDIETAEAELAQPLTGPLGFDLEWKPIFRKGQVENPVALVQLASADRILLFQITAMQGFPPTLREILQNPGIVKAGVSIHNDCKKLWFDYQVNVSNCVDLGLLARTVDNPQWKGKYSNPIGLSRLCETYYGLSLSKGKTTRSNWEAFLSPVQQEYAANDCHAGWALYVALSSMISSLRPMPLPSFYSFDLVHGIPFQPESSMLPMSQRAMWNPSNPLYDPGPPPEKPVKPTSQSSDQSESSRTVSTAPSSIPPSGRYDGVTRDTGQSGGRNPRHGGRGGRGFRGGGNGSTGRLWQASSQQSDSYNHAGPM